MILWFIHAFKLVTIMWATVSACAICLVVLYNSVFYMNTFIHQKTDRKIKTVTQLQ